MPLSLNFRHIKALFLSLGLALWLVFGFDQSLAHADSCENIIAMGPAEFDPMPNSKIIDLTQQDAAYWQEKIFVEIQAVHEGIVYRERAWGFPGQFNKKVYSREFQNRLIALQNPSISLWEALHRSGIESATKKTAIEIGASDQPLCDGCFYIDKDVEVAKGRINIQADAWHLPFEEQSLRLIVMVNFPFYDDPSPIQIKALFQQLHLLLEKGGQVIVAQRNTHPVIAHADMHYFFAEKIGFNVQTFGGPYLKYGNESMMGLLLSK